MCTSETIVPRKFSAVLLYSSLCQYVQRKSHRRYSTGHLVSMSSYKLFSNQKDETYVHLQLLSNIGATLEDTVSVCR